MALYGEFHLVYVFNIRNISLEKNPLYVYDCWSFQENRMASFNRMETTNIIAVRSENIIENAISVLKKVIEENERSQENYALLKKAVSNMGKKDESTNQ